MSSINAIRLLEGMRRACEMLRGARGAELSSVYLRDMLHAYGFTPAEIRSILSALINRQLSGLQIATREVDLVYYLRLVTEVVDVPEG